jgi:hypothetical protein
MPVAAPTETPARASELKSTLTRSDDDDVLRQIAEPEADAGVADFAHDEVMLKEILSDEAAAKPEAGESNIVIKYSQTVAEEEPIAGAARTRNAVNPEIEQELSRIMQLKRDGDDSWKKELETFKQNHPGYPIPAELESPE